MLQDASLKSEFLRNVKYLTPTKEIKNSTQQIPSAETDIQSISQDVTAFRNPCSKDFTTGKQPQSHEPTSYPCAIFIKGTTFQYAPISAKVSEATSFIQIF
jgi:hypothetical protein